jgi:hypothetical protein
MIASPRLARDPGGWIRYCLLVLVPAVVVFGLVGWASSSTDGAAHVVLTVIGLLVFVATVVLVFRGWRTYFR